MSSTGSSSSTTATTSRRAVRTLWQRRLLDASSAAAVAAFWWRCPQWFNPWRLAAGQWWLGVAAIRAALTVFDHLLVFAIDHHYHLSHHHVVATWFSSWTTTAKCGNHEKISPGASAERRKAKLLPTRTTGRPVRYVPLDATSVIYLAINALHEWIFMQRLCHYIWHSPRIPLQWQDLGLLNTVGAVWVLFIVMDLCYAPLHHFLHWPAVYPLIHKHHHRQHFPVRGYLDAGNEHPVEHCVGVACVWAAALAAARGPTGLHGATLFLFMNVHAALAMLNHSPYDIEFDWVPFFGMFRYSVGHHEMHHRKFTVNYSQYCMLYDHVMNTFAAYEGPSTTTTSSKKDA